MKKRLKFDLNLRIFKKNYCCICGNKLKPIIGITTSEDKYKSFGVFKEGTLYNYVLGFIYECRKCNYLITYKQQVIISRLQAEECKYILKNGKKIIKKIKDNDL